MAVDVKLTWRKTGSSLDALGATAAPAATSTATAAATITTTAVATTATGASLRHGGLSMTEDKLVFAGMDFDEIQRGAIEQGLAGWGDENSNAFRLERQIVSVFCIEAHAIDEFAVIIELGGDAQWRIIGLLLGRTDDLFGGGGGQHEHHVVSLDEDEVGVG